MSFRQAPATAQHQDNECSYNRDEEYLSAQRAAVEAVMVGRETLETAVRQGEQLQHAENLADETEYKLDRASRLLRGMTWSGWLANKFSTDVEPPEYKTETSTVNLPPRTYEQVPTTCSAAAQAVQNYHANVQVLEECETNEQRDTCRLICNSMYEQARSAVAVIQRSVEVGDFPSRLRRDLKTLRLRQEVAQKSQSPQTNSKQRSALFQGKPPSSESSSKAPSPTDVIEQKQEEHLDTMSRHLDELGSLATNLNDSLFHHGDSLVVLDGKSESMLFKSKMVTRRADRLIQKKSWSKTKSEFHQNVSIRHVTTGKFLSVSANDSLVLSDKFNETCIFGVWKRQGSVFGLQSKYSRKWVGQTLMGNLACSARYFDRREEWEADDDWNSTPLLCASAGWGNGGYLLAGKEDGAINIGGGGLGDKKQAELWCIKEHE